VNYEKKQKGVPFYETLYISFSAFNFFRRSNGECEYGSHYSSRLSTDRIECSINPSKPRFSVQLKKLALWETIQQLSTRLALLLILKNCNF